MLKKYVFVVKVYRYFLFLLYIKCFEECFDNVFKFVIVYKNMINNFEMKYYFFYLVYVYII